MLARPSLFRLPVARPFMAAAICTTGNILPRPLYVPAGPPLSVSKEDETATGNRVSDCRREERRGRAWLSLPPFWLPTR